MYFVNWHAFPVYSEFHKREFFYFVRFVREVELWTPERVVLANRVTAVLVMIDAALVAIALTIIYLAFQ